MAVVSDPPIVPVPASDPLFVDTLRAGLEAYVRGDYRRAADAFLDAAAIAGYRPEADLWGLLGIKLDHAVTTHALVSRDAAQPVTTAVQR
jgi:hypothetical protein